MGGLPTTTDSSLSATEAADIAEPLAAKPMIQRTAAEQVQTVGLRPAILSRGPNTKDNPVTRSASTTGPDAIEGSSKSTASSGQAAFGGSPPPVEFEITSEIHDSAAETDEPISGRPIRTDMGSPASSNEPANQPPAMATTNPSTSASPILRESSRGLPSRPHDSLISRSPANAASNPAGHPTPADTSTGRPDGSERGNTSSASSEVYRAPAEAQPTRPTQSSSPGHVQAKTSGLRPKVVARQPIRATATSSAPNPAAVDSSIVRPLPTASKTKDSVQADQASPQPIRTSGPPPQVSAAINRHLSAASAAVHEQAMTSSDVANPEEFVASESDRADRIDRSATAVHESRPRPADVQVVEQEHREVLRFEAPSVQRTETPSRARQQPHSEPTTEQNDLHELADQVFMRVERRLRNTLLLERERRGSLARPR